MCFLCIAQCCTYTKIAMFFMVMLDEAIIHTHIDWYIVYDGVMYAYVYRCTCSNVKNCKRSVSIFIIVILEFLAWNSHPTAIQKKYQQRKHIFINWFDLIKFNRLDLFSNPSTRNDDRYKSPPKEFANIDNSFSPCKKNMCAVHHEVNLIDFDSMHTTKCSHTRTLQSTIKQLHFIVFSLSQLCQWRKKLINYTPIMFCSFFCCLFVCWFVCFFPFLNHSIARTKRNNCKNDPYTLHIAHCNATIATEKKEIEQMLNHIRSYEHSNICELKILFCVNNFFL